MPENGSAAAVMVDTTTETAWDYLVVAIHARHNDILEEGLKERGRQGWELVFVNCPMSNEFQCIFRRRLH